MAVLVCVDLVQAAPPPATLGAIEGNAEYGPTLLTYQRQARTQRLYCRFDVVPCHALSPLQP